MGKLFKVASTKDLAAGSAMAVEVEGLLQPPRFCYPLTSFWLLFTSRTRAQLSKPFPGVKACVVTVRPHNLHRIIADQLHRSNLDVLGDGRRVDNALAGHFVDTPGTMASEA